MNDPFLQFLGLTKKAGKVIEGYNNCLEKIQKSKVYLCIVSEDVSLNTLEKFKRICERESIEFIQCHSSNDLGAAVGRDEINVLCISDKNIGKKLLELYVSNKK